MRQKPQADDQNFLEIREKQIWLRLWKDTQESGVSLFDMENMIKVLLSLGSSTAIFIPSAVYILGILTKFCYESFREKKDVRSKNDFYYCEKKEY